MPTAIPEFIAHTVEQMSALGGVQAKKMFGGWGLFKDGLMFAVVIQDELYFKVDDGNVARFESRHLKPFTYEAKGRQVALRYFQAPAETLEDPHAMAEWAADAWACALRNRKPAKPPKAPKASAARR